ncbi:MFS peptide transporter-like protein Ptr2 [Paraphaeosphaeria sporulosa]|uniref:MFS peptide transporter-like protein Ptr2 n=1 Tax=Paraphaeosphaeria sporulosa TaxID=1460663 RepID=A0A177CV46_9PLEO|nr:MFS peptide transporter-like protein Ptr2 [Paraphaeosphaeria sporulosa]OAG10772.1 MFS peptide transporter-like protein Ptr2 [Paraphaeosphaeria sporulosa]
MALDTRASLEATKGASAIEPIALDISTPSSIIEEDEHLLGPFPTEEEWATLPRVAGSIPWTAWTVACVEFVERFSYYGTSAVFVNFIQKPLPPGSKTGAGFLKKPGSGALDMGQRASTGLTQFNQFWSYFTPLFGAWLADEYWGRYKTIQYANLVAVIGHILLIFSAIPQVITKPNTAIGIFSVGLVIMGIGTGGFKSNISPLIAEQYKNRKAYVRTKKNGNKEIVDPATTAARIYIYFYFLINCGSLTGSLAMVYSEHFVGFWLSFTLPTFCYLLCPLILVFFKKHYKLTPPTGSVFGKAFKLIRLAVKNSSRKNIWKDEHFWERVKPSALQANGKDVPSWMSFDDAWVDEVRRGVVACKVFVWYPLYFLAYNQMLNNLVSQAGTMNLGSTPNDIVAKLNPIFIIIVIPIMDFIVYPGLRKAGIVFSPIKKITAGFALSSLAMVTACVIQYYIYKMSPCGKHINALSKTRKDCNADISVWVQVFPYGLIGMSEVLASITKLEYAYTKAPTNMKSTVQAIALFTSAVSSALGQALVSLSEDPLLEWNYGAVAVVAMFGAVGFYLTFRKADKQEDALNALKTSAYVGNKTGDIENEARGEVTAKNEKHEKSGLN